MRLNKPLIFLLVLTLAFAFSAQMFGASAVSDRGKPAVNGLAKKYHAVMDVNQIECFIQNNGKVGEDPATGGDGFWYPKGQRNASIIFTSGIWVLGKIDGEVRSAAADYATEFQPGMILPDGTADDFTKDEYIVYKYNKGETPDATAVAQGCPTEVLGDQMTFSVFNDMMDHSGVWTLPPIGIEVQLTGWGYNRTGALGNTLFFRYRFINKGAKPLEDAYVAVFFDPDLGQANDDFVACDTTLGVGYVYNGDGYDDKYGVQVPAMGCDFFQGPIVDAPGETATLPDGTVLVDKKILNMTAFFAYINGSPIAGMEDPTLQSSEGAQEAYFFVSGKRGNGEPWEDQSQGGLTTTFPFAGDPVANTGWLMGSISPPKDMRMGLSAGPFNLPVNDPKDVVIGLVVGQGSDNLSSVTVMKFYDKGAQLAYDLSFNLPSPPPQPAVQVAQTDEDMMLYWDQAAVDFENTGYVFEGYNVYQGQSAAGPWKKIATIDKINGLTTIWDLNYSEAIGTLVDMPVQYGVDAGLRYDFHVEKDYITNSPLINGKSYYFSVTGYAYNPDGVPKVLENAQVAVTATPQKPVMDEKYNVAIGDTIGVETFGSTDGYVIAEVKDPKAITGHEYEITFYVVDDTTSANYGKLVWKLFDKTAGSVVLDQQDHQTTSAADEDWPIVDGMKIKVYGAPNTFKNFQVVSNASGPLDPPEMGCFAFNASGFPFLLDYAGNPVLDEEGHEIDRPNPARQQVKASGWGIHTGMNSPDMDFHYPFFLNRVTNDGARWPRIIPRDFEIRFTAAGGKGYIPNAFVTGAMEGGVLIDVPFELWNVGALADPNDDVRYFPYLIDDDNNGQFNLLTLASVTAAGDHSTGIADHTISGGTNDPFTDWFYWVIPENNTPGQAGYEELVAKIQAEGDAYEYLAGTAGDCIRRMVLVNWNGGAIDPGVYNSDMPEVGTVFRIVTTKPNNASVRYTINTAAFAKSKSADVAAARIDEITVFPNPYFGHNQAEGTFFAQFVTFGNLPEKCTIRIFSLSGQLVRTIVHESGTPFERWDLLNSDQLPVGSGMFIVHIETAFGDKVLKLGVVNREQRYLHL